MRKLPNCKSKGKKKQLQNPESIMAEKREKLKNEKRNMALILRFSTTSLLVFITCVLNFAASVDEYWFTEKQAILVCNKLNELNPYFPSLGDQNNEVNLPKIYN